MKMILFEEDWAKYPSAIVDTMTKNKSFLDKSELLRQMGVKNNKWMLALLNPKLLGVDPHSPNLTIEQKALIALECKENFWYAVRNVWRSPPKAGAPAGHIQANRANLSLWWSFFNHITYVLVQPRQTGKSFSTDVLNSSLMNFHCRDTQINLMTKDDQLRTENISRLKELYEELPAYLQYRNKADANNTDTFTVNHWKNKYRTHVPQTSEKRAANTARGLTTPIFQIDEGPFQNYIEKAMPAALAGMGAVRDIARDAGQPYGIILTTTAGKKDDRSGKYVYDYCQAAAPWSEMFYDARDAVHLNEMVRKNSSGIPNPKGGRNSVFRVYANFNHRQLGKSDQWVREQIEELNATKEEIERDYLCRWSSGTQQSPIPTHISETISSYIQPEKFTECVSHDYILRWYIHKPVRDAHYRDRKMIIGIDTSDASGGDDIAFVGVDYHSGEVLVSANINETNLIHFAEFLVEFLEKYQGAIYVPERKNSAITIIDYLLDILPKKNINPFMRIFNWVLSSPEEYKDLYNAACQPVKRHGGELYVKAKKLFGFATSATGRACRDELYSVNLQNAVRRCSKVIRDRKLSEQITGLITNKRGRIDHEEGGHDDMVVAWLLAHWFMTSAKNLANYGLNPMDALAGLEREEKQMSPKEVYEQMLQKEKRMNFNRIVELMSSERNSILIDRYERELRILEKQIVYKEGEQINIDNVVEKIKQKKKLDALNAKPMFA
jgi:hypothetical protein